MNKILLLQLIFLSFSIQSQTDTINTKNHQLKPEQLRLGKSSYIVYFQNESGTKKHNFEIWDRTIQQKVDKSYHIKWIRHGTKNNHAYNIKADQNFKPISEVIVSNAMTSKDQTPEKKHFIFENNNMYSHPDSTRHNAEAFRMENTALAFNWEQDLEVLNMLPLNSKDKFAINFYHPGSTTPPQYYIYEKVREEVLEFNTVKFNCWVLKIDHDEKQWSEFWIDQKTYKVLQMRDFFYGKYRYKKLII